MSKTERDKSDWDMVKESLPSRVYRGYTFLFLRNGYVLVYQDNRKELPSARMQDATRAMEWVNKQIDESFGL